MKKLKYTGERYIPGQTARNVRKDHERRYRHVIKFIKGGLILDIACGSGFGIQILSSISSKIVGIDYSFDAISFARRKFMRTLDSGIQANAMALPFKDHAFDVVVSFETVEHLPEPVRFLKEIKRVLAPGGQLFISTPVKKGDSFDKFHFCEFTIDEFIKLVSSFFTVKRVEGQRFMFSPLFVLFSLQLINNLMKIPFMKSFYRHCYGKDEIRPFASMEWFTPNFILVSCKNEK